jgi:hypothetical protein
MGRVAGKFSKMGILGRKCYFCITIVQYVAKPSEYFGKKGEQYQNFLGISLVPGKVVGHRFYFLPLHLRKTSFVF